MGSCFSDNIGQKLITHKFSTCINPYGTIYNPYSIFRNLHKSLSDGLDPENYLHTGSTFVHWDAHSVVSALDQDSFQQILRAQNRLSRESLQQSRWMLITLGTAYIYNHRASGRIVANCHKIPQSEFHKSCLPVADIVDQYQKMLKSLLSVNPQIQIILTVSPVRHIRDGLVENNLSKSILLQAVHELVQLHENTHYFPAYEIMMDELRDYRFYKTDMIHPSQQAIDYIWSKFMATFVNESTRQFIRQWDQILKALEHRPFHPASDEHQQFLKATMKKLRQLETQVDVSDELTQLSNQLI